ncbi:MAG: hypothetical protein CL928_14365, partial [Deltaproteobacteria bacterium]|nr:hypothetical protein [Deltaproteobacteria bacterium]
MRPPHEHTPISLLAEAPTAGAAPTVLAREPGFAIKLFAPPAGETVAAVTPPGQGQLLVPLRGEAMVQEVGGADGKVIMTVRDGREAHLVRGNLFRVANDAQWGLVGRTEGSLVLGISTSVPREAERVDDLLQLARSRMHVAPRQVFANESVSVEVIAARGLLPFRGWLPYAHTTANTQYSIVLQGTFDARTTAPDQEAGWRGALPELSMLRLGAGTRHRFRA